MIRLFRWLLFGDGHAHRWKIIDSEKVSRSSDGTVKGIRHTLQCKVCGKLDTFETYDRMAK